MTDLEEMRASVARNKKLNMKVACVHCYCVKYKVDIFTVFAVFNHYIYRRLLFFRLIWIFLLVGSHFLLFVTLCLYFKAICYLTFMIAFSFTLPFADKTVTRKYLCGSLQTNACFFVLMPLCFPKINGNIDPLREEQALRT